MKRILAAALLLCGITALQAQVTIGGSVFGGGRMANVTGKTNILVKGQTENSTNIGGIYGGNDIAGGVNGNDGSNIVLGANELSSTSGNGNAIVIGEVYGGGNGYYKYPGLAAANTGLSTTQTTTTAGTVTNFDGTGEVATVTASTAVPTIKKTSVKVYGTEVYITDLFGGAKNAFVTNTTNTTANIDIKAGTITNAFGGNNFGGNIQGNIDIAVSGTKQPSQQTNAAYATVGETWGIQRLYGGGNKVAVPGSVNINITGGLIDTCFAGGNAATVTTSTTVTLNTSDAATYTHGTEYDGASGFYNIRTLFGGNNSAVMNGMPTLNLTKGGVGTVYGGGKSGHMTAGNTNVTNYTSYALSTFVNATSNNFKADVIYGGCQQANVRKGGTMVAVSGGEIGSIYGGCNISGFVVDTTISKTAGANVKITGGTIHKNVYGGGNGYYGFRDASSYKYTNYIYNNVDYTGTLMPVVNTTHVNITGGTIEGNVYAGGELAPVGVDRTVAGLPFTANQGTVTLAISETGCVTIQGNVFGGGRMAPVYGKSNLSLTATNLYAAGTSGVNVQGDVYGGNDIAGSITVAQNVTGSDAKNYNVATAVKLTGAVKIDGSVYGGGNGDYTYFTSASDYNTSQLDASKKALVADANDKPVVQGGALVDVNTNANSHISKVYGGGNSATVNSSATVLFNVASVPASGHNVDTIFGGNNNVAMSIMPNLDLNKGYVHTVYGGGNKGAITCTNGAIDTLSGLSTYVLLRDHQNLKVKGTIYGGCRVAGVSATAYVDLRGGEANDVFGGNDVGGAVATSVVNLDGNAKVSNIYGGGNGKYYYDGDRNAFLYDNHSWKVASNVANVTSSATRVQLTKGTVNGDAYGGGLAGNAGNTNVKLESGATVKGTIYGAGCGLVEFIGTSPLDHPHVGNVTGTARLTINGLASQLKRAFGGGRAGDVQNTAVVVKEQVDQKILAIYGGCRASDLKGQCTMTIGQTALGSRDTTHYTLRIDTLYGGNDFSGLTQNTNITINQGIFKHVFGAGNGDYEYENYLTQHQVSAGSHGYDTVPYSMNVNVVYNGGYFKDRTFGGGNMGLVGDKSICYTNYPEATQNSALYGRINVDIHDGYFAQHVFAGARGSLKKVKRHFGFTQPPAQNGQNANGPQNVGEINPRNNLDVKMLAYAYKQVNMDGGIIRYSLYGGSEAVDDGYPYECYGSGRDETSLRPSSVINIVGGTVMNRVYGGGYRGNVYGSIYVNIGQVAVSECPVWTRTYTRLNSGLSTTFGAYSEKATALEKSPVNILASIYNGSDWGEAGQNEYFDTRGFFGGEGLIFIDGEGYQTSLSLHSMNPEMQLSCSIIGAGTSTAEADARSRIIFRNYGDFYCPSPSRAIKSIQRTNKLFVHNVYVTLTGEQDAFQSYTSSSLALSRIDTVIFHEHNLLECKEPSEYIGRLRSEDRDSILYTNTALYNLLGTCTDEGAASSCDLLSTDVVSRNTLLIDNGVYLQLFPYTDANGNHIEDNSESSIKHDYGVIDGWLFLLAPNGTRASVMARPKDNTTSNDVAAAVGLQPAGPLPASAIHPDDGGFVCPCKGSNVDVLQEVKYGNVADHGATYRTWTVGTEEGERRRHITLVAHANPEKVIEDEDMPVDAAHGDLTNQNFGYAKTTLMLPPSNGGNYYVITSVSVDDDNGGQVTLTDWAYDYSTNKWFYTYDHSGDSLSAKNQITQNPNYTFGMQFKLANNFDLDYEGEIIDANNNSWPTLDRTIVSGNSNLSKVGGFISKPIIEGAQHVLPTLEFTLAYSKEFTTTVTRDVVFRMEEYNSDNEMVGPVDVTVTISTVLTDFNNLETPLLAMYNEDTYDKYVRKVIVPASFLQRNLYLESIEWAPTTADDPYGWNSAHGTQVADPMVNDGETRFQLQSVNSTIDSYKKFSISITPTQDVTDNISNSLGWYDVQEDARDLDIYALGNSYDDDRDPNHENKSKYGYVDFTNNGALLGKHIGVLDGRAAAAFDVTLNYDGARIYQDIPDLAHAKLKFRYINTQDNVTGGEFTIDIKLRTRRAGDTIYMAEPQEFFAYTDNGKQVIGNTLPEGKVAASCLKLYTADDLHDVAHRAYKKNDPYYYLNTFQRAIDVYDEGDVICIMDPIHISNKDLPISIQGADYSVINITRYTGSHWRWPGEVCAYRGPMIVVSNGAKFTSTNVRYDGGGCGRVAVGVSNSGVDGTNEPDNDVANCYVRWNNVKYSYRTTQKDTTFAHAPIFWVEDGSRLNMRSYNTVINNFSSLNMDSCVNELFLPGGAIGAKRTVDVVDPVTNKVTHHGGIPQVTLGNQCNIYSNIMIDNHRSVGDNETFPVFNPDNYGAAIYSNGANITLGNGKTDNIINADKNFYIPKSIRATGTTSTFGDYFFDDQLTVWIDDNTSTILHRYKFNQEVPSLVPNNIYLTRTPATSDPRLSQSGGAKDPTANEYKILFDTRTDLINVVNQLSDESHIGVSKWFPGFIEKDLDGRDTIGIVNYAVAGSLAAAANYASGIYTDDSAHVQDQHNRRHDNDDVDVRYSSLLNTMKIYLHRCGTFRELDVPIRFGVNPDVVCPGDGDSIWYRVSGGAANYTYTWSLYDTVHREYVEKNSLVSDKDSGYVVPLELNLEPSQKWKVFQMKVDATEAGGCHREHYIDVLVKRVGDNLISGNADDGALTGYTGGRYDKANNMLYSHKIDNFMGNTWNSSNPHGYPVPKAEWKSSMGDNGENHAKAVRLYGYYTLDWETSPVAGGGITATTAAGTINNRSELCPGDQVHLNCAPADGYQFLMWDDDPSMPASMDYVVTRDKEKLTAYLAPRNYWYQVVTSDPGAGHFETDYHGRVHIYDSTGLAWLISTTNGINQQQPRSYAFDTITIHYNSNPNAYDMAKHKWTPLGTTNIPFRGHIVAEDGVEITHLIVNEDDQLYLGMFGRADSAHIEGLTLKNCVIRGQWYSAGMAGYAGPNSSFKNCRVDATNTIAGGNCAAGLVATALNAAVRGCTAIPTLVGNTIHAGGLAGYGSIDTTSSGAELTEFVNNLVGVNGSKLSSLYLGGLMGSATGVLDGAANPNSKGGNSSNHIRFTNNSVSITSSDRSFYVGGLVGNAEGVDMENNYAYGTINGFSANGGLVGWVGEQVTAENCYYADAAAKSASGNGRQMSERNTATFTGEGNHVTLSKDVAGASNLTIALNQWVRNANASKSGSQQYNTWRSDLENQHDGYPLFGTPDQIPVYDTVSDVACDAYTWYDSIYTQSGTYSHVVSDSANYVDNITIMNLTVHYSQSVEISDSVELGRDYTFENYTITADQIRELLGDDTLADVHTLQIVDSLFTENGCDSVVTYNLTIYGAVTGLAEPEHFAISVYPNPTMGRVEVKADALQQVELYDAVSRKVMEQQVSEGKCLFDLSNLPSGSYYLRIRSAHGTAVKKVVKR